MTVNELIEALKQLPDIDAKITIKDVEDTDVEFEWVGLETSTTWACSMERGVLAPIDRTTVTTLNIKGELCQAR